MTRFARGGQGQCKFPSKASSWNELKNPVKSGKVHEKEDQTLDKKRKRKRKKHWEILDVPPPSESSEKTENGIASLLAQHDNVQTNIQTIVVEKEVLDGEPIVLKKRKKAKNCERDSNAEKFSKYGEAKEVKKSKRCDDARKNNEVIPPSIEQQNDRQREESALKSFAGYDSNNSPSTEAAKVKSKTLDKAKLNKKDRFQRKQFEKQARKFLQRDDAREARRQKRIQEKLDKKVCFKCRQPGHDLVSCPKMKGQVDQGTGICFKCGTTEHTVQQCRLKLPAGQYPYATCFICNNQGHLSKKCPQNPRGLYPNGGACKECGGIDHLVKDCPELMKKKGINNVKLSRWTATSTVEDDGVSENTTRSTAAKKPTTSKVVSF